MDMKNILDQILQSGREIAQDGQNWAETSAGLPSDPEERQAALQNLGKGALGAGVMAMLLGTQSGRRVTGSALKLGGLAALGGLAYKTYQSWNGVQSAKPVDIGASVDQLDETGSNQRSELLLSAMISAAKADGHIDSDELDKIKEQISSLDLEEDAKGYFLTELEKPLDINGLAAAVDSSATAAEIYLISLLVMGNPDATERAYLEQLAAALGLSPQLVANLERKMDDNNDA